MNGCVDLSLKAKSKMCLSRVGRQCSSKYKTKFQKGEITEDADKQNFWPKVFSQDTRDANYVYFCHFYVVQFCIFTACLFLSVAGIKNTSFISK